MSDKQTVFTDQAPAAIGPYSQAVLTGKLVFVSGQTPLDPATGGLVGENAADQAEQCLKNLKAILEKSGASLDSVVKTTVFLVDMADFAAMNEVYARWFQGDYPARSCVAVRALPKGARVDIEAVAVTH